MYVETEFTFEDYKIEVAGAVYYVAGSTRIYSDKDWDFEFDPAEITFAQDAEFDEIDPASLPIVAALQAVHTMIDADPYVFEVLEMERASWK